MPRHPGWALLLLVSTILGGEACGRSQQSSEAERVYLSKPSSIVHEAAWPVGKPVVVARFEGEIEDAVLPKNRTKGIPIGPDPRFVLVIGKVNVVQGALPGDWDGEVTFLIHSPAMFFGLKLGESRTEVPKGRFMFTLSKQPYEGNRFLYDLAGKREK